VSSDVVDFDFIDLTQSYKRGRGSFLFIESGHFVVADLTFNDASVHVNSIKRYGLKNPITREEYKRSIPEIIGILKQEKNLPRNLTISLPSTIFGINIFTLPKTKGSYVNLFIQNKLEDPDGLLTYKYRVLREIDPGKDGKISIFVCSTLSAIIKDFYYNIEKAGFSVKMISHHFIGLIELLNRGFESTAEELTLLVDTSIEPLSLSILNGGTLEHIRFLNNIQVSDEIEFIQNLSLEINRTFHFCKQHYSGKTFDKIIYCGKTTKLFNVLCENLQTTVERSIEVARLAHNLHEVAPEGDTSFDPYLNAMCGLYQLDRSLQNTLSKRGNFNFISAHSKSKSLVVLMVVMLVVLSVLAYKVTTNFSAKNELLNAELETVNGELAKLDDVAVLENEYTTLNSYVGDLKEILKNVVDPGLGRSWPVLALVECVPDTSEITQISLKKEGRKANVEEILSIRIKDNFAGDSSYSLEQCMQRLQKTGLFKGVEYQIMRGRGTASEGSTLEEALLELKL
jgi:hypothetical protein